mmetsp:Transcript_11549/g.34003  ORF Transcript_11549/g.34003 Transcript_11549/m.34003 type:complete len:207 (-) Transcript_11549:648-1268(-)
MTTWSTSGISRPRAAKSVQTRAPSLSSSRNALSDASLSREFNSPWYENVSHAFLSERKCSAARQEFTVLQKIRHFSGALFSTTNSSSSLSFPTTSTSSKRHLSVALCKPRVSTVRSSGRNRHRSSLSLRSPKALLTAFVSVAVVVTTVAGFSRSVVAFKTFSSSAPKPWLSIVSTSSTTTTEHFDRWTSPKSQSFSKRPGVAINKS